MKRAVVAYKVMFFINQKTAYEMSISDWSSDVCSSDLQAFLIPGPIPGPVPGCAWRRRFGRESHRLHILYCLFGRTLGDRKSVVQGKSVYTRVDISGRRIIKKKKHHINYCSITLHKKLHKLHQRQNESDQPSLVP